MSFPYFFDVYTRVSIYSNGGLKFGNSLFNFIILSSICAESTISGASTFSYRQVSSVSELNSLSLMIESRYASEIATLVPFSFNATSAFIVTWILLNSICGNKTNSYQAGLVTDGTCKLTEIFQYSKCRIY